MIPEAAYEPPKQRTLLDTVWESIITPGAGPGLIATINGSLIALILITMIMMLLGLADIHLFVLLFLSLGLLASVNW
jgi:hypothetical protein